MNFQVQVAALTLMLLVISAVGATQIEDPPIINNEPEISDIHPPDEAQNLSANPDISFRVKDVDSNRLDVVVLQGQSEIIYNEKVDSGSIVEIAANNTTLGDQYNSEYSWTIEVSDNSSTVTRDLSFTTMNPFTESTLHEIGDSKVLLDYSGSGSDLYFNEDCPEWENRTTCISTTDDYNANLKHIEYDKPLYLLESNKFNVQFRTYSYYDADVTMEFYDENGTNVQFTTEMLQKKKFYDWNFTFDKRQNEDGYAVSWEREMDNQTKVKFVDFSENSKIYWRVGTTRVDHSGRIRLWLYEWDTDMATLKEDANPGYLSVMMSMF